jgi:hypothetical protein
MQVQGSKPIKSIVVRNISEATGNMVAAKKLAKNKPRYPYSKLISTKKAGCPAFQI